MVPPSRRQEALDYHSQGRPGKIQVTPTKPFKDQRDLSLAYTPGVAEPCLEIAKNPDDAYRYTAKGNLVAVVSNGTAVLGLGNIGALAGKPVMEGKGILFKAFADIDVFDLEVGSENPEDVIRFCQLLEPTVGGINLEDIRSPDCFYIEQKLRATLGIPVFHDDQHGTALIALAGLLNALKLLQKRIDSIRVVIAGAGSAGYGIFRILKEAGCRSIVVTDSQGAIYQNRPKSIDNPYKKEIADETNPMKLNGSLADVLRGADVFIGVSGKARLIDKEMVQSMNNNPIVFALSNPDPEILPADALEAGASIVATGRSDFANQVNNAVVFPAILRSLLDLRVKTLSEEMLVAVATSIADIVDTNHLKYDYIIPKVDDPRIIHIVTDTLKNAIQRHLDKKIQ